MTPPLQTKTRSDLARDLVQGDVEARRHAAESLPWLKEDPEVMQALLHAVTDPDGMVRARIARGLWSQPEVRAFLPQAVTLLSDPDPLVVTAVMLGISESTALELWDSYLDVAVEQGVAPEAERIAASAVPCNAAVLVRLREEEARFVDPDTPRAFRLVQALVTKVLELRSQRRGDELASTPAATRPPTTGPKL